jgi:hypothetical protein
MTDLKELADAVAVEIAAGRLRPGDQSPPQRQYVRATADVAGLITLR